MNFKLIADRRNNGEYLLTLGSITQVMTHQHLMDLAALLGDLRVPCGDAGDLWVDHDNNQVYVSEIIPLSCLTTDDEKLCAEMSLSEAVDIARRIRQQLA